MSRFQPDLYYRSVFDIDLDDLAARGIRTLLLDLDNTLLPRNFTDVPAELREWLDKVRAAGISMCIVSNNWHDHVQGIADDLDVPLQAKAVKPMTFAFKAALKRLDSMPKNTAVVGDQVFTDVLGGRLLGATTILVVPLAGSDLPHTAFLRMLERRVLAGRNPLP